MCFLKDEVLYTYFKKKLNYDLILINVTSWLVYSLYALVINKRFNNSDLFYIFRWTFPVQLITQRLLLFMNVQFTIHGLYTEQDGKLLFVSFYRTFLFKFAT